MKRSIYFGIALFLVSCGTANKEQESTTTLYGEQHRPQVHFSPNKNWMNDPNGMVFLNGTYHLFFQHYPDGTTWGPMHWGHATSTDLIHWKELPIALYPDSLGYIFSGSAVADVNNTSGFGKDGKTPLIAIFTHHDPKGEKEGITTYQNQSLAYSLDEGTTWTKYANNPVVKNPGIKDFRDPKVMWYEEGKKWIMTLATLDRVTFYSSPDLKIWKKESEYGQNLGAHGGVWECPDLFQLTYNGQKLWVLFVSINPGGPNGGSATQYFVGQFDGNKFTSDQADTRWIDYGTDNYAGVTWSNTGDRKLFMGWMSNWQYANVVPTETWRSATTIARELGIQKVGDKYILTSRPVNELSVIEDQPTNIESQQASDGDLSNHSIKLDGPAKLEFASDTLKSFSVTLSNDKGEKVIVGYDKGSNNYYIDRSASGKIDFGKGFVGKFAAPRFSSVPNVDLTLIIDNASVELFADNGLSVMTEIFFPNALLTDVSTQSPDKMIIKNLKYTKLKSIWR